MRKFHYVASLLIIILLMSSCTEGSVASENSALTTPAEIDSIISKYLSSGLESGVSKENIDFFFAFDLSTEGASFVTIHNDFGKLEYLGVDIFGEMGRISHSYTFTEHFIVYSVVEVTYAEPFFVNPMDIPIDDVSNSRYVISDGRLFRFVDEGESVIVDDEFADSVIARLINFLDIVNSRYHVN